MNFLLLFAQQVVPVSAPAVGGYSFTDWVPIVLSLIATAVAGWYGTRSRQQEKRHEKQLLNQTRAHELQVEELKIKAAQSVTEDQQRREWINGVLEDSRKNRESVLLCEDKIRGLEDQVSKLTSELKFYRENSLAFDAQHVLRDVMEFFEAPAWLHAVGDQKWYVNDHFCDFFGVTRRNFWAAINLITLSDDTTGSQIVSQDLNVVSSGSTIDVVEQRCKNLADPADESKVNVRMRKAPITIGDKKYVVAQIIEVIDPNP